MQTLEEFLREIGLPLRKLIRTGYNADSCIASCRIGMDLLARFDIKAEPLAVKLLVLNAAYVRHIDESGHMAQSIEERERWYAEDGAHSIGIGIPHGLDPGRHVVLIVEGELLWDLSIDQASRPERDIMLAKPFLAPTSPAFLAGREMLTGRNVGGTLVSYSARPGYDFWSSSPNWQADGHDAPMRSRMVAAALDGIAAAVSRSRSSKPRQQAARAL